mmetsp:Transcript_15021/g.34398  ORF Transcript_15021/g.34398 Transcript_15021/m.34398 type:complete len:227 (-) Transcript_15021:187-867(-)
MAEALSGPAPGGGSNLHGPPRRFGVLLPRGLRTRRNGRWFATGPPPRVAAARPRNNNNKRNNKNATMLRNRSVHPPASHERKGFALAPRVVSWKKKREKKNDADLIRWRASDERRTAPVAIGTPLSPRCDPSGAPERSRSRTHRQRKAVPVAAAVCDRTDRVAPDRKHRCRYRPGVYPKRFLGAGTPVAVVVGNPASNERYRRGIHRDRMAQLGRGSSAEPRGKKK